jgi:hypothetical protein
MSVTPNFSWPLIEPTDFVTNLPADLETLADAIDDTVKDLNPGTTAGDIDYYTSSTAKSRVGIGTAGQVLTVNSGATAPEWASISGGGMTLLSTTSLPVSGSTLDITGISQDYKDLRIEILNPIRGGNGNFYYTFNSNTGSVYDYNWFQAGSASVNVKDDQTNINGIGFIRTTDLDLMMIFEIKNYANTDTLKPWTFHGGDPQYFNWAYGSFDSNSAVSSFQVNASGNTFSGGTVKVWGIS